MIEHSSLVSWIGNQHFTSPKRPVRKYAVLALMLPWEIFPPLVVRATLYVIEELRYDIRQLNDFMQKRRASSSADAGSGTVYENQA